MVSHDLLKRFSAGFQRFQKTWYCPENNIYEDLRAGQNPYAMVIACSDSRVDPVILLDATPGDLFVVRNVANLVPPYEPDGHYHGVSAALEYAVRYLRIGHIMVMGHARCGGFTSLLEADHQEGEFLNIWMSLACRAKAEVERTLPEASGDGVQLIAVMVHGHYLELSADKTEIGGVQGDLALHRVAASDFLTSDTVNHSVSSCVLFLGFAVYP